MYYQTFNANRKKHHDITYFENIRFDRHLHNDFELAVPTCGAIRVTTEEKTEVLSPGSCALILSDQMHAYETVGVSGVFIHVFSPDIVGSFVNRIAGRVGTSAIFPVPRGLTDFYLDTVVTRRDYGEYTLKGLLYLFLERYLAAAALIPRKTTQTTLLSSIFAYIGAHFTEKITLEDVAKSCGYDAHYLSRVFSSAVGINFKRVVNSYRLDYARTLLEESDLSITEVALASGFGSVRNFNRAFSAEYNELPKERRDPARLSDATRMLSVFESKGETASPDPGPDRNPTE